MTEEELLLWGANHQLDANSRSLLGAAIEQVGLIEQAVGCFANVQPEGPSATAQHADSATISTRGMPSIFEAQVMEAVGRQDTGAVIALLASHRAQARRLMLHARSFVCELALFRKLIEQLSSQQPSLSAACSGLLGRLDVIAPDVVALRDSLAHFDERAIGRAWKRNIQNAPHTANGETLNRGLRLSGNIIGGHTASGSFAEVEISMATVDACRRIVRDAYSLFPPNPGLHQAMANYRAGVVGT